VKFAAEASGDGGGGVALSVQGAADQVIEPLAGVTQVFAQPQRLLSPQIGQAVIPRLICRAGIGLSVAHKCDFDHCRTPSSA